MPFTVKALQKASADEPFKVVEIERRDPRADDVVIDIKAAGVCHSDIHTVRNEWGQAHFPLAVGHEIAGVVSAVGEGVTKYQVGDRVGVGCLVNSCGECEQCRNHQEQACLNGNVGTYNSTDVDGTITQGGYSQKVVVNENFVCRIPDSLDFDVAAPLLCAGITTYSPLANWNVHEGQNVAVLGLGGLGHMGVQIAVAMGANVTVLSRTTNKEAYAKELGASRLLATSEPDFFTNHRGEFDFILNTVAAQHDLNPFLNLLRRDGTLTLVGAPEHDHPSPQVFNLIMKRRRIAGSLIGGIAETQEMLDFCGQHGITSDIELIPMQQINEAYERMLKSDVKYRFVVDIDSLRV
ncbi:MAG: NAD(P)-dependent alcohol dehydrogenase [Cutibacterium granulosum]|uniref:NAD(P)-dependent alcohol dehydrogenase n=1 Tax=Cutibacterium granulosum TaxID=33011 RepID=UPI0029089947|nr:NAD(P)-dependent alcohol dehydrogenase [Cutibacterium granulosum]MDU3821623.1 NAD(P)-dependent alcohol dehydrogenase [Cutibacterium granulosum]